jgi:PDZ domain-containing protein
MAGATAGAGSVERMFRRAVRVATIGGVDVRLDPSLVLIVALLTWMLDARLSLRFPDGPLGLTSLLLALLGSVLLLLSVLAHELAHALTAQRRGIRVGGITLFALGGATELEGHGRTPRDELTVAFVGPWVSIVLAAGFGLVATSAESLPAGDTAAAVGMLAGLLGWLNLGLAAFNLLPAAPLDGGRVLHALLWRGLRDRARATSVTGALGAVLGVMLVIGGARLVVAPGGFVSGVATVAVGVFVTISALAERRRRTLEREGTGAMVRSAPAAPSARRSALTAGGVAVVMVALLSVPMPFVEYRPGGATSIEPLVEIVGAETTPLEGGTALLTVRLTRPAPLQLLAARLDRDRELLPITRVYPQGVDRQDHLARERQRFDRQFEVAAAVGAAAAGVPLEVLTEVVVIDIAPGGPADGRLAPGDVVLAVDGTPVTSGAALAERVSAGSPGDRLTLRISHAGSEREEVLVLAALDDTGQARIGVIVQTAVDELRLPIEIRLTPGIGIGGPSAGLMVGLTVYDLLAPEDLLAGRLVAGTGTLDVDGRVGDVGGVAEKTLAAVDAGYDVLLVPASSLEVAERAAAGRLRVVGVATLDEALRALR